MRESRDNTPKGLAWAEWVFLGWVALVLVASLALAMAALVWLIWREWTLGRYVNMACAVAVPVTIALGTLALAAKRPRKNGAG